MNQIYCFAFNLTNLKQQLELTEVSAFYEKSQQRPFSGPVKVGMCWERGACSAKGSKGLGYRESGMWSFFIFFIYLFFYFALFLDRVLLCSSAWPRTDCVD